MAFVETTHIQ